MANTDYLIIINPKIKHISAANPEKAIEKFRIENKLTENTNLLVCPRNASKLNGKYISPKNEVATKE